MGLSVVVPPRYSSGLLNECEWSTMISTMAVHVLHLVDAGAAECDLRTLNMLLRHLPADRVCQSVVRVGVPLAVLDVPKEILTSSIGHGLNWPMVSGAALQRQLRGSAVDVVFAWGAGAAATAISSGRAEWPVVATVSDPSAAEDTSKWWRSSGGHAGRIDVICSSQVVQRRLVEAGLPIDATAVIRPGVDFGEIRALGRRRDHLPIEAHDLNPLLVTASPPSRAAGQFNAVWAVAILRQIWPTAGLIVPGRSREQERIRRLVDRIDSPAAFVFTEWEHGPAALLAGADALVAPAIDDAPTGWIPWAMAASVPVVGSAVPCVTEMIADRHNGFLCKPDEPHTLASRIRFALTSDDIRRQCVETARGQAYDVFRSRQCIDAYLKVIDNILAGRRPITDVRDAAIDG